MVILKQSIYIKQEMLMHDRIILYTWLIAAFLITSFYAGCVLSLMTIPTEYRIETISELDKAVQNKLVYIIAPRHPLMLQFLNVI